MKTIIAVILSLVAAGSGSLSVANERLPVLQATPARRATTGAANFTATPWAEVWINGKKLGETPLMNHAVPLGKQEFVFKHPRLGERRVTVTIRADSIASVNADMNRAK
jgi:PEGA domain